MVVSIFGASGDWDCASPVSSGCLASAGGADADPGGSAGRSAQRLGSANIAGAVGIAAICVVDVGATGGAIGDSTLAGCAGAAAQLHNSSAKQSAALRTVPRWRLLSFPEIGCGRTWTNVDE